MIVPVPAGHAMMHAIRSAGIPWLGRMFILTPDLPRRFATRLPIAPERVTTWFMTEREGYLHYPPAG